MSNEDSLKKGQDRMAELFGSPASSLGYLHEDFAEMTVAHVFGEVWTRPGLELRERSLMTCAVLAALGKEQQLAGHLAGAKNIGISQQAAEEIMIHVAHYAGWPCGVNGLRVVKDVYAKTE